jgi:hypothetical protein
MWRKPLCFGVAVSIFLIVFSVKADDATPSQSNTKEAIERVGDEIYRGNPAEIDAAVAQIRVWVKLHRVNDNLWRHWLPDLMTAQRYDYAAELALAGAFDRPEGTDQLLDFRTKALLAMDKPQDALQAAKSYYNTCAFKKTPYAIQLVALCLVKCRPDDPDVARRFRDEQANASAPADAADASQVGATQSTTEPTVASTLKSIVIDQSIYKAAIADWSQRSVEFSERVSYGNILLAADRCEDAEKVYRELYKLASTQKELDSATEGIARTLRAEDGNVNRANAWLLSLQQAAGADTSNAKP